MSKEMDELKKRLNINKLNEKDRKQLYDKFVEKGGKVVKGSKKSQKSVIIDREKQKEYLKDIEKHRKKVREKKELEKTEKQSISQRLKEESKRPGFILKLRGAFSGVINFFNGCITEKTFSMIKNVLQDCFVSLSYVGSKLLHPKVGGIAKVKRDMLKKSPFSYEFLVRLENLYDESTFNKILLPYEKNSNVKLKPYQVKDSIQKLFRKLFLYYSYEKSIIESVTDGLELNSKLNNFSKEFIEEILYKTKSSLKIMYSNNVFNKMFVLYMLSTNNFFTLSDFSGIMNALNIKIDEIGSIAEKEKKELDTSYYKKFGSKIKENIGSEEEEENEDKNNITEESEENTETENLDEEDNIPEDYAEGKRLFDNLDFSINKGNDPSNKKRFFKSDDKMLYTIVSYEYFDREFSFLLNSSRVSYSVDYVDGKKIDIRNRISQIYINLTSCRELMDEYIKVIEEIYKIENDNTIPITQKYNRMNRYQINQTKISYDLRKRLLENYSELAKLLDYSIEYSMIINSEERLSFDKIDGKRDLEGKTHIEAAKLALSYLNFLSFMLEKGMLSGPSPTIS